MFTNNQNRAPKMTIGRRVTKTSLKSLCIESACRRRSIWIIVNSCILERKRDPTSMRLRFLLLNTTHLMFNAISLNALAIFKPSAILTPVVIVLYSRFDVSLWAGLCCQMMVAAAYAKHITAVMAHRADPAIKICLNCLPVLSLYGWNSSDVKNVSILFTGSWRNDCVSGAVEPFVSGVLRREPRYY
jgi:hypothetical protein